MFSFVHTQQQAALMAAAQGTAYINPMAALATHATLNGMANSVVPPTSGELMRVESIVPTS